MHSRFILLMINKTAMFLKSKYIIADFQAVSFLLLRITQHTHFFKSDQFFKMQALVELNKNC